MNRKVRKAIYTILSVIIMLIIFYFSAQEATVSQGVSDGFINKILFIIFPKFNNLSLAEQTDLLFNLSIVVRKTAHFLIYALLGFCLNGAMYNDFKISRKIKPVLVLSIGLIYAISDELHQYFVPGRAMKLTDVLIDFCGVMFGAFVLFVIYCVIKRGRALNLNNVDIYELINRDLGKIIHKSKKGVVATTHDKELVITDLNNYEDLKEILIKNNITPETFTVKNENLKNDIENTLKVRRTLCCSQWVYTKLIAPKYEKSDIRTLTLKDIDTILEHYKLVSNKDYLVSRINDKSIFGIYENNTLAGFIGIHSEGSIGMLEIFPEFRRKGYGYILEAFVIEQLLDKGYTPYCHVVEGNNPSYKLQEKLGYKKTSKPSIWINI